MNRKHTTERPACHSIGAMALAAGAAIGWGWLSADVLAQAIPPAGAAVSRNVGGAPVTGSKISNPALRSSIGAQNRLNNAIVTGNVGGGKQFRGSVGYSGDLDFRGRTGSDDLFQFQRDSFGSGLAANGLRGIGGLQDSMNLSTNQLPSSIAGATILQRESAGVNATALGGAGSRLSGGGGGGINPSTFRSGGLRSLSKNTSDAVAEPVTFAPRAGQAGAQSPGVGASALRGLYALTPPTLPPGAAPGATAPGSTLRTSPETAPPTRPGAVESQRVSAAAAPAPETTRIESESTYQRLLAQLEAGRMGNARAEAPANPATGAPENKPGWVRPPEPANGPNDPDAKPEAPSSTPLNPLGAPPGVAERGAGPQPQAVEDAGLTFNERLDRLRERLMRGGKASDEGDDSAKGRDPKSGATDEATEEKDAKASDDAAVRRDAKDLLGGERPKVVRFIDPTTDPTALDRHMLAGQQALAKDKWFDAEESFTKAILARPTDPMPAVGRVHAQIGAGMFLSAAINARTLFRAHPELAAAQYDSALLPRAGRLEKVFESLRDAATRDDAFGRDCGLLLAYLGWQTGSQADVEAGLGAVDRIEKHLEIPHDPLIAALRAVWTPATP